MTYAPATIKTSYVLVFDNESRRLVGVEASLARDNPAARWPIKLIGKSASITRKKK
jgi:hypothetical protein